MGELTHDPVTCPWCARTFTPPLGTSTACECGHAMYSAPTEQEWADFQRLPEARPAVVRTPGAWSMWSDPVRLITDEET